MQEARILSVENYFNSLYYKTLEKKSFLKNFLRFVKIDEIFPMYAIGEKRPPRRGERGEKEPVPRSPRLGGVTQCKILINRKNA